MTGNRWPLFAVLTACTSSPDTPAPPPFTPPLREVVVVNVGDNSIVGFAIRGGTVEDRVRTIGGGLTSQADVHEPLGVALDPFGNIYVSNSATATGRPDVTVYAANLDGDVPPTDKGNDGDLIRPQGIRVRRSDQAVLVANHVDPPDPTRRPSIREYLDGAPPTTLRSHAITGPSDVLIDNHGGNIIVVDSPTNAILSFAIPTHTDFDGPPTSTIAGPNTKLDQPSHIAQDADGRLYVTNLGNDSITVYAQGASGDVAPIRWLGGPGDTSNLQDPFGIAVDGENLYVTQGNTLLVFDQNAIGGLPKQVVTDGLNLPTGVAVR